MAEIKLDIVNPCKAYWSKRSNRYEYYFIMVNNSGFDLDPGEQFKMVKTIEGPTPRGTYFTCDFATITQVGISYFNDFRFVTTRTIKNLERLVVKVQYVRAFNSSFTVQFKAPEQVLFDIGTNTYQPAAFFNMVALNPVDAVYYDFKYLVIYKDKYELSRHIVRTGYENRLPKMIRFEPSSLYEFDLQDNEDINQATYELEQYLQGATNIEYREELN